MFPDYRKAELISEPGGLRQGESGGQTGQGGKLLGLESFENSSMRELSNTGYKASKQTLVSPNPSISYVC